MTSIAIVIPYMVDGVKKYFVHTHSFIPASRVDEHIKTDKVPYDVWISKGLVTVTETLGGIKTDYKYIIKYLEDLIKQWKDERYTDAESLKEDAEAKLDELSKPYRSYTAEIINLVEAVQDEEKKEQYKEVFSIALGDTVLLISKSTGIRESHRIVKFYEYPLTKEKNKVELANTRLSFEEVQRTEQELS